MTLAGLQSAKFAQSLAPYLDDPAYGTTDTADWYRLAAGLDT